MRVFVLPDLNVFEHDGPTGTQPALVEHLVDLLADQGFTSVVGRRSGPDGAARDSGQPGRPWSIADLVGYRLRDGAATIPTTSWTLSEDLVDAPFPPSSALAGHQPSPSHGSNADIRISFAKNKTHAEAWLRALRPQPPRCSCRCAIAAYHYRARLKPWDTCVDLLRATPVHVAIVDASRQQPRQPSATAAPRPLRTDTVIAGTDPILVDFVAAAKMNTDPYASPVNAKALHDIGLPQ